MQLVGSHAIVLERDTERFARELGARLSGGESVGLVGQLGAGKTTLVRYLVPALGLAAAVSSPSYVLCHEYSGPGSQLRVEHWDLYRLAHLPEELHEPPDAKTVRCIEWADKFPELDAQLQVKIEIVVTRSGGELERELREYRNLTGS